MRTTALFAAALMMVSGATGAGVAQTNSGSKWSSLKMVSQAAMTAEQIAIAIQAAIDALPEGATQEEIEEAIAAVLISSGASVAVISLALASLTADNAEDPLATAAIAAVAAEAPDAVASSRDGLSGGDLAALIQQVLDALPEDATEAHIEVAIAAAVARSGATPEGVATALAIVSASNSDSPRIVAAAAEIARQAQQGDFATGGGGGSGSGDAPQGATGGNSDY